MATENQTSNQKFHYCMPKEDVVKLRALLADTGESQLIYFFDDIFTEMEQAGDDVCFLGKVVTPPNNWQPEQ